MNFIHNVKRRVADSLVLAANPPIADSNGWLLGRDGSALPSVITVGVAPGGPCGPAPRLTAGRLGMNSEIPDPPVAALGTLIVQLADEDGNLGGIDKRAPHGIVLDAESRTVRRGAQRTLSKGVGATPAAAPSCFGDGDLLDGLRGGGWEGVATWHGEWASGGLHNHPARAR